MLFGNVLHVKFDGFAQLHELRLIAWHIYIYIYIVGFHDVLYFQYNRISGIYRMEI